MWFGIGIIGDINSVDYYSLRKCIVVLLLEGPLHGIEARRSNDNDARARILDDPSKLTAC